jgi:hypothetical protein
MKKPKKHEQRPQAAQPAPRALRRTLTLWLPAATLLTVLVAGAAVGIWAMTRSSPPLANSPLPSSSALSPEMCQRLVGRWLRPDGGYVMTIDSISADGAVAATYANPKAIHVSRAQAANKDGHTGLFIELRDTGYPGNYYILTYDPIRDELAGVYHHLGVGQTFEVTFERMHS